MKNHCDTCRYWRAMQRCVPLLKPLPATGGTFRHNSAKNKSSVSQSSLTDCNYFHPTGLRSCPFPPQRKRINNLHCQLFNITCSAKGRTSYRRQSLTSPLLPIPFSVRTHILNSRIVKCQNSSSDASHKVGYRISWRRLHPYLVQ